MHAPLTTDGNDGRCNSDEDSWGPTWNTKQGGRCPFDDPGVYSTIFGRTRSGDNEPVTTLPPPITRTRMTSEFDVYPRASPISVLSISTTLFLTLTDAQY